MRLERKITVAAGLAALTLATAPRLAEACAVCGLDLDGAAGHAFKVSVLFMMAVPYVTFLIIGSAMYLSYRKSHPEAAPLLAWHRIPGVSKAVEVYKKLQRPASKTVPGAMEGRGETL